MPSQQLDKNYGRDCVEYGIRRRQASCDKKRQGADLDRVNGDRDQPSQAKLRRLDRFSDTQTPA